MGLSTKESKLSKQNCNFNLFKNSINILKTSSLLRHDKCPIQFQFEQVSAIKCYSRFCSVYN